MDTNSLSKASAMNIVSTPSTNIPLGESAPRLSVRRDFSDPSTIVHDKGVGVSSPSVTRPDPPFKRWPDPTRSCSQRELTTGGNDAVFEKGSSRHAQRTKNKTRYFVRFADIQYDTDTADNKQSGASLNQAKKLTPARTVSEHSERNPTEPIGEFDFEDQPSESLHEGITADTSNRKARKRVSKIFKVVKQSWKDVWNDDEAEISNLRWIYKPETTISSDSPFYKVQLGVRFQDVVPERPAVFPYPSQIAYSSRYGSSVLPSDPSIAGGRPYLDDEARLRERLIRQALMRRKATGRFRRRPNITLPMTDGRTTQPVEVARIRRAYNDPNKHQQNNEGDKEQATPLEKMNRQARTGTVEWTVTRISPPEENTSTQSTSSARTETNVIKLPIQEHPLVSRRSLRRTVSTRFPDRPRNGGSPRIPRSVYMPKQKGNVDNMQTSSGVVTPSSGENIVTKLERVSTILYQSKGVSLLPKVVITSHQDIACESVSDTPATNELSDSISSLDATLLPPRPLFHYRDVEKETGDGPESHRNSGADRLSVDARMSRRSVYSNRSSVYSNRSASSNVSAVSSLANSVYSTLSEDWNRPTYYAKAISPRYPVSMQSKIKELPPLANFKILIKPKLVSAVETSSQMEFVTEVVRSRGLRHQNGDPIQIEKEDELYEVKYNISQEPLNDSTRQRGKDSLSPFTHLCKSAKPDLKDTLGFIDYGMQGSSSNSDSDNSVESDDNDDDIIERKVDILDVNDTSEMEKLSINPSDPHPNPEWFYNTQYEHFQEYGYFLDIPSEPVVENKVDEPSNAEQAHGALGFRKSTRKIISKSKKIMKGTFRTFQALVRGNLSDSSIHSTKGLKGDNVEIMDDTQPSYSANTRPDANGEGNIWTPRQLGGN
ncbi:hypothetical protein BGZ79_010292 [Entomortierella chlamydospora]|nr:hypothetical protein BGZ79_010292 [Entomortierella chlamydospora]